MTSNEKERKRERTNFNTKTTQPDNKNACWRHASHCFSSIQCKLKSKETKMREGNGRANRKGRPVLNANFHQQLQLPFGDQEKNRDQAGRRGFKEKQEVPEWLSSRSQIWYLHELWRLMSVCFICPGSPFVPTLASWEDVTQKQRNCKHRFGWIINYVSPFRSFRSWSITFLFCFPSPSLPCSSDSFCLVFFLSVSVIFIFILILIIFFFFPSSASLVMTASSSCSLSSSFFVVSIISSHFLRHQSPRQSLLRYLPPASFSTVADDLS